ncbi:DNA topoisomerase IV subunit A [Pontiella agarivorans]|uniref:DNA topoisomerase IV subunit A n=1 Tax=Pontiella agarivorans TaxID=3038953 RepID=A0ABU5MYJ8_9BACT|nr:DNA topoisomerase IV subunit A [Pontiella agarivorans]MDZ8119289.1 DNA topoisomerase IV subunit A [Pontiella agarivorans]
MARKKKDEEPELFEEPQNNGTIPDPGNEETPAPDTASETEEFTPLHDEHGPLKSLVDFNFLQYASYVICDRAIPALEDGLKPVQRRILHALKEKDDGRFIKVANIVGHTMQYHPHGDASIADALVTLTNKRYLIEGQGNFGNLFTGDRAAASRYIECRLTPLARNEIFNKELTEWIASYDGRNKEPVTLPCKLPLMLMLGADGIAVGLSTSILPHNFIELLEAQIEILREKKRSPVELNLLPDFQTGGLMDVSEYNKGNGKVKLRAKIEPRKNNRVVITALPHGVTTESLTNSIEDAVKKKKVPVRAIDDFTAEKVEIELTLTQGASQEKAIETLYAFTKCETSVSSRLICLRNNRPVEMNVDEVLRENVQQLLRILDGELKLKQAKLLDDFHNKTLVQIFVENRIYKKIEQCRTYEAVYKAIYKGLDPFKNQLKRAIVDDDIEMLLGVRIKRISLFDIEKNRKDIEAILAELDQVEKDLKGLNGYTIRYIKRLIKEYKDQYPRRTESTSFKEADVRELTASELSIKQDENGYIGTNVKGEEILQCSSLDKLLIILKNGQYKVIQPPEKIFVDGNLERVEIYDRDKQYTCVYTDARITYLKRFKIGGAIMNREYYMSLGEKSKLKLLVDGTPESIYVKYNPAKGQRIHQQKFTPSDIAVKSVKSRGNRMTTKSIKYIGTEPGRWWDPDDAGAMPEGVLL